MADTIDFGKVKQGSQPTLTFVWPLPTSPAHTPDDLDGFTITGTMQNLDTGDVTAISSGAVTVTTGATRTCAWAMGSTDTGTAGSFLVTLTASDGTDTIKTLNGSIYIESDPSVTAIAGESLEGVPTSDAAWLATAAAASTPAGYWMQKTTVPSGTTVEIPDGYQMLVAGSLTVDGTLTETGDLIIIPTDVLSAANNLSDLDTPATARTNLGLGTAAVADVGTSAGNVVQLDGDAQLPAVDGSQLTNLPSGGASDVDDLTTTTGVAGELVRVASGGGLEYRTAAETLSDLTPSGVLMLRDTTADATNKNSLFTTENYNNANADFVTYYAKAESAANTIYIGGYNTSGYTAATKIAFMTSGNNTTTAPPAERVGISATGLVGINESSPGGRLHLTESSAGRRVLVVQAAASPTVPLIEGRNSTGSVIWAVGGTGALWTNQGAPNTNTPSGATAYQLPIYNGSGTLLGYIPIYGSAW